jgi:transcriptional regulator with XRE-family HTH domain
MSDQLQQIAARIRELREISNLSQATLAHDLNLSLEEYVGYEDGKNDIPISLLYQVASRFGVELTALLTGENPRLHRWALVRKGQGVSVERVKEYKYQSLAFNFIHKRAEPFLVTVDPKPEDTPIHFNEHPGQEFNYVLSGTLKIIIDGHELVLNPGDSLFFDSSCQHGMQALGEEPAQFLAVVF